MTYNKHAVVVLRLTFELLLWDYTGETSSEQVLEQGTKVPDIFIFVSNRIEDNVKRNLSQDVAVVVPSDSQFSDVAGESSGQSLQMFVAAAHHCVHTGTLGGTLRPRGTAAVLQNRAWTHRREGGGSDYFSYIAHC